MSNPRDRLIRTIPIRTEPIISVAWSPDRSRIAETETEGWVGVYSSTGQLIWRHQHQGGQVDSAAFSPDGTRLATGSTSAHLKVWDSHDGSERLSIPTTDAVWSLAWSRDGRRLLYGVHSTAAPVRIIDAETGTQEREFLGNRIGITAVGWSPDNTRVAAAQDSPGAAKIWDVRTGSELTRLTGHTSTIRGLAWSPDGRMLATAAWDHTARIWDTESFLCLRVLDGHTDDLWAIKWSPDGQFVVTPSSDGTIRVWRVRDGAEAARLEVPGERARTAAYSPDGSLVLTGSGDGNLHIWDVSDLAGAPTVRTQSALLSTYIARHLASVGRVVGEQASPELWVPTLPGANGDCLGVIDAYARSVALSPDDRRAVTGDSEGNVRCWDLTTGQMLWEAAEKHTSEVKMVNVSPDGNRVASTGSDNTTCIWDMTTGNRRCMIRQSGTGWDVTWTPDGTGVVVSAHNAWIYDATTGEQRVYLHHPHIVLGGCLSPDSRFMATAVHDFIVRVWDLETQAIVREGHGHTASMNRIRWSPDGRYLASTADDHTARVWDAATCQPISVCEGSSGQVQQAEWSPDSRWIATAAPDGYVRIWEPQSGKEVARFTAEMAWGVNWSHNGAFLVTGSITDSRGVRLWDVRRFVQPGIPSRVEPAKEPQPVPTRFRSLPESLARLQRLGMSPPLGLVGALLRLTGRGEPPEGMASLVTHPGVAHLRHLGWPVAARVGLIALLLRETPTPGYELPKEIPPGEASRSLRMALSESSTGRPFTESWPTSALELSATPIDGRLIELLRIVGPDAVAADPGLPLRLLSRLRWDRPASVRSVLPSPRQAGAGTAPSAASAGVAAAGIDSRGPLSALLPWQWGLPQPSLTYKLRTGGLLYRSRPTPPPVRPRPAVIVLDGTPGSSGPAWGLLRRGAMSAAHLRMRQGVGCFLVLVSGELRAIPLTEPGDLAEIWAGGSLTGAEVAPALRLANSLATGLGGSAMVLVFGGWWFGEGEPIIRGVGMRGIFAGGRGSRGRPALAGSCERWAMADGEGGLPAALAEVDS